MRREPRGLEPTASLDRLLVEGVGFVEHRGVDWARVRRARHFAYQRFHYAYDGLVRDLRQQLIAVPPDRYGDQRLLAYKVGVEPIPISQGADEDPFGNRVLEFGVARLDHWAEFEVMLAVERTAGGPGPAVSPADLAACREPTRRTAASPRIEAVARDLAAASSGPRELAEAISRWVSDTVGYGHGFTDVGTTAAEALEIGRGLCQDHAHLFLAVARAAGMSARYVSGHLLGEGGSHAWVEALLPDGNGVEVLPLDATNRCRPHLGYITVAVGRDYGDVPPTSGRYTSPHQGRLTYEKRAGLTLLEYETGEVVTPL